MYSKWKPKIHYTLIEGTRGNTYTELKIEKTKNWLMPRIYEEKTYNNKNYRLINACADTSNE